jgi:hypothetical protein
MSSTSKSSAISSKPCSTPARSEATRSSGARPPDEHTSVGTNARTRRPSDAEGRQTGRAVDIRGAGARAPRRRPRGRDARVDAGSRTRWRAGARHLRLRPGSGPLLRTLKNRTSLSTSTTTPLRTHSSASVTATVASRRRRMVAVGCYRTRKRRSTRADGSPAAGMTRVRRRVPTPAGRPPPRRH